MNTHTSHTSTLAYDAQLCYNEDSSSISLLNNKVIPASLSWQVATRVCTSLTRRLVMNSIPPHAQNLNSSSASSRKRVPRDNPQDILMRMKDHNLITDFDHWSVNGKWFCNRYVREGKTPLEWATACSLNKERHCIACGNDMKGREVWECYQPGGRKRCICKLCRHEYTMDENGHLRQREEVRA